MQILTFILKISGGNFLFVFSMLRFVDFWNSNFVAVKKIDSEEVFGGFKVIFANELIPQRMGKCPDPDLNRGPCGLQPHALPD